MNPAEDALGAARFGRLNLRNQVYGLFREPEQDDGRGGLAGPQEDVRAFPWPSGAGEVLVDDGRGGLLRDLILDGFGVQRVEQVCDVPILVGERERYGDVLIPRVR